jgi:hypothetical protein
VTLSDESEEEEAPEQEKFLAFVAPLVEDEDSYYSKHSDNGEELKEAYKCDDPFFFFFFFNTKHLHIH